MTQQKKLRVMELFAGVGGFRLGLEKANKDLFDVTWANQWEPSRKVQHAFECYIRNFPNGTHSNEDISEVPDEVFQDYASDLVVGGFPCQDYSVARSLSGEQGIQGKKGVLFWEIERVLRNTHPKYVLLENVDRLLKSPSKQRGRDFAVMLATFNHLDYVVEWRVINAADYGHAQRRRRVFIFAYKKDIVFDKEQRELSMEDIVFKKGFFAKPFPVKEEPYQGRVSEIEDLPNDRVFITDNYSYGFHTAGVMRDGKFYTAHTEPVAIDPTPLRDILLDEAEVDDKYYLSEEEEKKFEYLRGAKKVERTSASGHKYFFSEGGMSPTDSLDLPGRTMLTSEGTKNRSTHIVEVNGRKRYLTPIECERLNGFNDNWTEGMPDRMRYFCMGNALVVNLIETMGRRIEEIDKANTLEAVQLELL
ncbi:DNA (cytosine-5-)-methyltransferase [Oceanobacillus luteolus]|uniref:Cytosine-specific methyltransferase n=1 Tax=Oceanobacillus luteolus TaxID=1274358 RepID=A0ABW4HWH4_9BACI